MKNSLKYNITLFRKVSIQREQKSLRLREQRDKTSYVGGQLEIQTEKHIIVSSRKNMKNLLSNWVRPDSYKTIENLFFQIY